MACVQWYESFILMQSVRLPLLLPAATISGHALPNFCMLNIESVCRDPKKYALHWDCGQAAYFPAPLKV